MKFENIVSNTYEFVSKALMLFFLIFLSLLIMFISLNILNTVLPNKDYLLKYADLLGSFVLITVTSVYAYDNHRMVKQNALFQKANFTKERLEKFYLPFKYILNSGSKVGHILDYDIFTYKQNPENKEYLLSFKKSITEITPYIYLASEDLRPLLSDFYSFFNKNYYKTKLERERTRESKSMDQKLESIVELIYEQKNLDEDIYFILISKKDKFLENYEKIINKVEKDIEKYEYSLFEDIK